MEKMYQKERNGKKISKFHDWSTVSVNYCTGCSNDCRYCYAKGMAIRFGQVKPGEWANFKIREYDVLKKQRKYDDIVMFPSSHDIVPGNLEAGIIVLRKLIEADNKVLVVSKPCAVCIERICQEFQANKSQILFRFTITAMDGQILKFWESNSPAFEERKRCLALAYKLGFDTSVSIEPMLDANHIDELVADLLPYVTETIWIGKMNHIGRMKVDTPELAEAVERIKAGQTTERIKEIYSRLNDIPQIRWKSSIRDIV